MLKFLDRFFGAIFGFITGLFVAVLVIPCALFISSPIYLHKKQQYSWPVAILATILNPFHYVTAAITAAFYAVILPFYAMATGLFEGIKAAFTRPFQALKNIVLSLSLTSTRSNESQEPWQESHETLDEEIKEQNIFLISRIKSLPQKQFATLSEKEILNIPALIDAIPDPIERAKKKKQLDVFLDEDNKCNMSFTPIKDLSDPVTINAKFKERSYTHTYSLESLLDHIEHRCNRPRGSDDSGGPQLAFVPENRDILDNPSIEITKGFDVKTTEFIAWAKRQLQIKSAKPSEAGLFAQPKGCNAVTSQMEDLLRTHSPSPDLRSSSPVAVS